jgi:hypothetical protein
MIVGQRDDVRSEMMKAVTPDTYFTVGCTGYARRRSSPTALYADLRSKWTSQICQHWWPNV